MRRFPLPLVALAVGLLANGCGDGIFDPDAGLDGAVADDSGVSDGSADANADSMLTDTWQQIGGRIGAGDQESEDPAMLWADGSPAVGYRYASHQVRLQRWTGASWSASEPDPTGGNTIASIHRAPDFCSDGDAVFMAYARAGDATANDDTFYDRIFVYRWRPLEGWAIQNGGAELSEPWNVATDIGYGADEASIACSTNGPVVSWIETDAQVEADNDVFVAPLGGSTSPRIDRVAERITDARVSDVAVDAAGAIYIAHFEEARDATFETELYVTRIDGAQITSLGGAIDRDQDATQLSPPSIAVTSDRVFVAYAADRGGAGSTRQVYVARWNGSSWSPVGGGPVTAFPSDHQESGNPDLVLRDGGPIVAWDEADSSGRYVFVASPRAGGWEIIADRLNVDRTREALDPSLAQTDEALYVAFEEFVDGFPRIFVKGRALEPISR